MSLSRPPIPSLSPDDVHEEEAGDRGARRTRHPGWPLTALFALYPLWWALGMGTLIVFVLAIPMALHLRRRRPVRVPPAFGLWLLFLAWVVASTVMLGANPPGTLPGAAGERIISVAFNLAGYVAVTVVMLYIGNLSEAEYPRARVVRQLAFMFVIVVAGGLLGTLMPSFQFTSVVEQFLPRTFAQNAFVQSLVHPAAAQVQTVLGYSSGRPAAPFGYTNTWGNVLNLLLGWFAISWLARRGPRRFAAVLILILTTIPIISSLNRGLWIGLGATAVFAVVWLARSGHFMGLVALAAGVVLAGVVVMASPLTGIVQDRLAHPKSDGIRSFTISKTMEVTKESPILGFGSTRRALGSSNSIAVGRSSACANCGNPTLGSTGQLWQLLIAQGFVGTALYLGYFLCTMWSYRRDRTALAGAAMLALGLPFMYMTVYNALVMPLLITFISIGLLWRNATHREADIAPRAASTFPGLGGSRSPSEILT